MRALAPWFLGLCLLAETPAARGAEKRSAPPESSPAPAEVAKTPAPAPNRTLAVGMALVPGVALHGSGHFVAGRRDTAYRLLVAEGVGLALLLGGVGLELASGNSRALAGPALTASVLGAGVFVASFGADLYGSLASDQAAADAIPRAPPRVESEVGYRYVADPRFSYGHFLVESLTFESGPLRLTPSGWFATNAENVRYRLESALRLYGLFPGERGAKEDHLDVVVAGMHHRYGPEQFTRTSGEVALDARFDLSHLGDTLRGGFCEFAAGYAYAKIAYDLPGVTVPPDTDDVLLLSTAVGVALRGRAAPGSEARVYYDHRHDDFAAGLLLPGRVSGVFGHVGGDLRWYFGRHVGMLLDAKFGSALIGGLSLLLREGKLSRSGGTP